MLCDSRSLQLVPFAVRDALCKTVSWWWLELQLCLLVSFQIDEMNIYGNTALHIACYNGQDSVVNELIDYGANVNQPNNNGFTPLHFAAASTHGALCLELLVNNGADVNVQVNPAALQSYFILFCIPQETGNS